MAAREVTQGQWTAAMVSRPWSGQAGVPDDPSRPAVCLTWEDAMAFAAALNERAGEPVFRLPRRHHGPVVLRRGPGLVASPRLVQR